MPFTNIVGHFYQSTLLNSSDQFYSSSTDLSNIIDQLYDDIIQQLSTPIDRHPFNRHD